MCFYLALFDSVRAHGDANLLCGSCTVALVKEDSQRAHKIFIKYK